MGDTRNDVALDCARSDTSSWPEVSHPLITCVWMPWATLAANVLGCSLMGICFALLQRDSISERIRGFLMVVLLGSLTTFSAYSQQLFELIEADRWGLAFGYGPGSVFISLAVFCLSVWGARGLLTH